ncbi:chaperonin 10-like protein [Lipomyces doorenjongii]
MSDQHLAALLPSAGASLEVTHRPTPTPGPHELLIEVKSVALNPVDWAQRSMGIYLRTFPAVLGSDVAGTVISVGSSVPSNAPQPGTRVAAFASCFYEGGDANYGAFQQRVLVPDSNVTPLPPGVSFNEASMLPMAVMVAWTGWRTVGVPVDTKYTPADKKGVLIWGGASSVGSAAVQTAKSMGFVVYTTASAKHHEYLKSLGASKVFDYKAENVEQAIVKAAKKDELTFDVGFDAVGQLKSCMDILMDLKADGTAMLASAPLVPEDAPKVDGVVVKFITPPSGEKERAEFFHHVFRVWLKEKLVNGEFVPSPKVQVLEGGLEGIQNGLDRWRKGVSGVKLVLEV